MAKTETSPKIKLRNVRLAFPTLAKPGVPKGYDNADPKYSAVLILNPEDEQNRESIKLLKKTIDDLIKAQWGEKPVKMKPIDCFGKGNMMVRSGTNEVYDGFDGNYFVSANNKKRVLCLDRAKNEIHPDDIENKLYGGCYVDVILNFWAQDNQYGQAIRCSLSAVRFWADGDEFGGGGASADDFDDDEELEGEIDFDDDDDIPF